MFRNGTVVSDGHDAECFKTAFYRFLETNPPPIDEAAWLESRMGGKNEPPIAIMWSQEAAEAFRCYLAIYTLPSKRPMRFSRFDDLRL